jgi:photosystem II stability/assembly factor-like uncharacterized protein
MLNKLPAGVRRVSAAMVLHTGLVIVLMVLLARARAAAQFVPFGYDGIAIYAADCREGGNIAVAGARGTIAVSRDGGVSWRVSAPLPEGVLADIQYLDDQRIIAVGAIGTARRHQLGAVARSDDGGASWSVQVLPAGLLRLAFAGPRAGFALATDGRVLRTLDGGWSWEETAPLAGSFSPRSLALFVSDPLTVIAGTLRGAGRSDNGGASWQALSPPALGAWIGAWASGRERLWFAGEYGVAYSDDAGITWRIDRPWPGMRLVALKHSDAGVIYAVVAPTAAAAAPTLSVPPAASVLLRSRDGGYTWQRVAGALLPAPAGTSASSISTLCPAGSDTLYLIGEHGAILKSLDGGVSWATIGAQLLGLSRPRVV